jgi:hypothetical protein
MGFSTIYLRPFHFDRALSPEHAKLLLEFSETEHEDENGEPGGNGKPPTFYCQWIPTEDRSGLERDKNEKFYFGEERLAYLIKKFIKPWGYTLNGESPSYVDDFEEAGILRVTDSIVSQEPRDILLMHLRRSCDGFRREPLGRERLGVFFKIFSGDHSRTQKGPSLQVDPSRHGADLAHIGTYVWC